LFKSTFDDILFIEAVRMGLCTSSRCLSTRLDCLSEEGDNDAVQARHVTLTGPSASSTTGLCLCLSRSTLISGAPGTAKSTLCSTFVEAACRRGERALFVSFDEATDEVVRNLASVNECGAGGNLDGSLRW
jgi:hypothetical protein